MSKKPQPNKDAMKLYLKTTAYVVHPTILRSRWLWDGLGECEKLASDRSFSTPAEAVADAMATIFLKTFKPYTPILKMQFLLSPSEADLLELLLDRLTYSQVLECTDGNNNEDQAYEMQAVAGKLRKALAGLYIESDPLEETPAEGPGL